MTLFKCFLILITLLLVSCAGGPSQKKLNDSNYSDILYNYLLKTVWKNEFGKRIDAIKPNQISITEITYFETKIGNGYITLITDTYSKKNVGYRVADNLLTISSAEAFKMSIINLLCQKLYKT